MQASAVQRHRFMLIRPRLRCSGRTTVPRRIASRWDVAGSGTAAAAPYLGLRHAGLNSREGYAPAPHSGAVLPRALSVEPFFNASICGLPKCATHPDGMLSRARWTTRKTRPGRVAHICKRRRSGSQPPITQYRPAVRPPRPSPRGRPRLWPAVPAASLRQARTTPS